MNLLLNITSATLAATAALDLWQVYKRDLMMLQQNSYRNERYTAWFNKSGESTNIGRIFCCVALFILMVRHVPYVAGAILASVILLCQFISLARKKYKKPLVWTPRAKRIYAVMWVLALIPAVAAGLIAGPHTAGISLLATAIISPIFLLLANWLLKPVEKSINNRYYREAADILASMPSLKIIGITGSYGKTSTKHYLCRILQEQFATTMTPGSYNTTMGVIRTIREHLRPYDEVFICEMGAKNIGDIKEICDLVHPHAGIVTAVGEQHLESFKTIENVQRTKFELADAIPAGGFVLVNNDFPYAASREVTNTTALRYGIEAKDADYYATDIVYGKEGTRFVVHTPEGAEYPFETRLVGECNISNLIPAIAIALRLGMPVDKVRFAVSRVEQVEHRLNMKHTPGGITIIDDAFNSNPHGSRMALDVLRAMDSGKRIVITPGMIELGDRQREANEEFGRNMARSADVAVVVGAYNRDAILAGLRDGGMPADRIHAVDTFAQAQNVLSSIARSGDTVLYENDLPDTFK